MHWGQAEFMNPAACLFASLYCHDVEVQSVLTFFPMADVEIVSAFNALAGVPSCPCADGSGSLCPDKAAS